ncbi:pentapeptide repeat-containing protein [Dactylosporangium sp. NPDC049742]|uniref:pentapeptide repeat-containing protein n=1 Tax=Dactylosporangium sp. NPDC049742 TaxID=3154737 RepID=UPI00342DE80B
MRADCANCFGLCCVAPAFARSADFAIDKPAGHACPNLGATFGCGIHTDLRQRGFAGCTVYDCFGAGQKVAQVTFAGRDWRQDPGSAPLMFDVFATMRHLHELLWYLSEARDLPAAAPVHADLDAALSTIRGLTDLPAADLAAVDVDAHRTRVVPLLRRAGELARAEHQRGRQPFQGRHLVGKDLRRTDLRGADLRGAVAVGADLRGSDLSGADVTGADLRGADLRGADLRRTLFLIQSQLDAARGDATTRLPAALTRPGHWTEPPPRPRSGRPAGPRSGRR